MVMQAEIDQAESNDLMQRLLPIIRDYLENAHRRRGGDPINNFTVLNALAVCAAMPLNGAPEEVYRWFVAALDEARNDLSVMQHFNGR